MQTKFLALVAAAVALGAAAFGSVAASAQATTYATPGGPYASVIGRTLVLTAVASNAEITSYRWDFGDGSFADGREVAKTYFTPGVYTVSLTVTTAAGQTSTATTTARIVGYPTPVVPHPCAVTRSVSFPANASVAAEVSVTVTRCLYGVPVDEVPVRESPLGQTAIFLP